MTGLRKWSRRASRHKVVPGRLARDPYRLFGGSARGPEAQEGVSARQGSSMLDGERVPVAQSVDQADIGRRRFAIAAHVAVTWGAVIGGGGWGAPLSRTDRTRRLATIASFSSSCGAPQNCSTVGPCSVIGSRRKWNS